MWLLVPVQGEQNNHAGDLLITGYWIFVFFLGTLTHAL